MMSNTENLRTLVADVESFCGVATGAWFVHPTQILTMAESVAPCESVAV